MQFIDLTVLLNETTPVYPGDPSIKIIPTGRLEKDGFNDSQISFGTHIGTHIDAPFHMISDGQTLNKYGLDKLIGSGRYVEVSEQFNLKQVQKAGITKGDIVLFHTGMSDKYHDARYFETYPTFPSEVADYLVEQEVKMVGVDMCSVDHAEFTIHKKLLSNDILIIENLTNLSTLAGKSFKVYALPIKLELDGAPARVIAELKD